MAAKITRLPQPASHTIEQVFDEFLGDQRRRLRPRTLSKYEDVLGLLRDYLNRYAYQSLSTAEAALFDRYYNAPGDKHLEFYQLFGPDKIVANLGGFLGYFMIRKVVAGQDLKRAAGTVMKKLSTWLAAQGHVAEDEAQEGADLGAEAARDLPKAERAARILYDATTNLALGSHDLGDDFLEFDHRTIVKVEAGRLWLEGFERGTRRAYGPILVPAAATKLLCKGWDLSCALGRVDGTWRIVEVANVYPV